MKVRNPLVAVRQMIGEIATAVNASAEYSHCGMKASAKRAGSHMDVIVL